MTSLAEP